MLLSILWKYNGSKPQLLFVCRSQKYAFSKYTIAVSSAFVFYSNAMVVALVHKYKNINKQKIKFEINWMRINLKYDNHN